MAIALPIHAGRDIAAAGARHMSLCRPVRVGRAALGAWVDETTRGSPRPARPPYSSFFTSGETARREPWRKGLTAGGRL